MDIKKHLYFLKEDLEKVEALINSNFESDVAMIPRVSSYISNGGGKRLRPVLLLMCSRLCGSSGAGSDRHIQYSCVVEYIHAASLLHDDVVDSSDTRRGNISANVKWGNQGSVLVGDYLFSKAFDMVARESEPRITRAVSEASMSLAEGEVKQLMKRHDITTTEEDYLDVIRRKTGSLIIAACRIGAILGNASDAEIEALSLFGENLGSAFQLIDDMLDYTSSAAVLGKPVGNDLKEGNITYPLIYLYKNADEEEKREIKEIVDADKKEESHIKRIIELMNTYGAIGRTADMARQYVQDAKARLKPFQSSKYFLSMNAIADYVIERNL